jgi:hypothetical protein
MASYTDRTHTSNIWKRSFWPHKEWRYSAGDETQTIYEELRSYTPNWLRHVTSRKNKIPKNNAEL